MSAQHSPDPLRPAGVGVTTDLVLDSLQRRMGAMHSLWHDAVATMDLDQVNHAERDAVLPIAFSLFHFVQIEDTSASLLGAGPAIYDESRATHRRVDRRPRQGEGRRRDGAPPHR